MKRTKLNDELSEALQSQFDAFKQKFGREPGPDDPIFFDPDADQPRFMGADQIAVMREQMCEVMRIAGLPPAIIYAYTKTDRIVTKENQKLLTQTELKEWNSAIQEYYSRA